MYPGAGMGIQDRDYYREGSSRFFDSWGRQGATVWLIVITSVVFFVQCFSIPPIKSPLVEIGAYSYANIVAGEVWRLLTPIFLHSGLFHLFFNMLVLYWAGSWLEDIYGPGEFLAFYLLGGVFASCVNLAAQASGVAPLNPSLGASGAVTATLVLFAFHFPWQRIHVWFIFPMPVWAVVVLYVILDGLGAAGVGRGGIGYIAHLGGALFGAVYFQTGIRFTHLFARSPRRDTPRAAKTASDSTARAGTDPRTRRRGRRKRATAERSARRSRREGRCSAGKGLKTRTGKPDD